jgi:hypothetical protein
VWASCVFFRSLGVAAAAFGPRQRSYVFFTAHSVSGMATSVFELKKIGCFYFIWVSCSMLTCQGLIRR